MKKNILLMVSILTLLGCSNKGGNTTNLAIIEYKTDYSSYTLQQLTGDEATRIIDNASKKVEFNIDIAESFIGNYSVTRRDSRSSKETKIEINVNYNFKENKYKYTATEYEDSITRNKYSLEASLIKNYLICSDSELDTSGTSAVEKTVNYATSYTNLEEYIMLDEIIEVFSFKNYSSMFLACVNSNSSIYGRELNKELTEKRIFAPDFIKLNGSSSYSNYSSSSYTVSGVVNKGWLVNFSGSLSNPSSSSNYSYITYEINCEVK